MKKVFLFLLLLQSNLGFASSNDEYETVNTEYNSHTASVFVLSMIKEEEAFAQIQGDLEKLKNLEIARNIILCNTDRENQARKKGLKKYKKCTKKEVVNLKPNYNVLIENGSASLPQAKDEATNEISVFKYAVLEKATPESSKELTDQIEMTVRIKNTSNYYEKGRWGVMYYPGRAEKYINDFDRCMIDAIQDFAATPEDMIYVIRQCQRKTKMLPYLNAYIKM